MGEVEEGSSFAAPFFLTFLSGISTGLGGVVVLCIGQPSVENVGLMEAFAAGVMIFLSMVDLAWPAMLEIGMGLTLVGFIAGGMLFWGISQIPMPSVVLFSEQLFGTAQPLSMRASRVNTSPMNFDTSLGITEDPETQRDDIQEKTTESTNFLIPSELKDGGGREVAKIERGNVIEDEAAVMEQGSSRKRCEDESISRSNDASDDTYTKGGEKGPPAILPFLRAAIVTAIAISLHNFPEGIAVYLTSLKGLNIGLVLAIGIALHNIPGKNTCHFL